MNFNGSNYGNVNNNNKDNNNYVRAVCAFSLNSFAERKKNCVLFHLIMRDCRDGSVWGNDGDATQRCRSSTVPSVGSFRKIENVMGLSEELPIYRDTYRLQCELLTLVQNSFPRFFRYTVGNRMVDINLDMLSLIYRINSSFDKRPLLTELLDKYRLMQMLFRLCVEQKVISPRAYAPFAVLLDNIGRQATGWMKHCK